MTPKEKRRYEKTCAQCGEAFLALHKTGKYCSDYCRWRFYHLTRSEEKLKKRHEAMRKWGQANWLKRRAYMLNYTYGITLEQYDELLKKQNDCCYICQKPETDFGKKLAVDHDHSTGEIFGLLCHICNKIIIGKCRDPVIFNRASDYLKKGGTGWFVPKKEKKKYDRKKRTIRKRKR